MDATANSLPDNATRSGSTGGTTEAKTPSNQQSHAEAVPSPHRISETNSTRRNTNRERLRPWFLATRDPFFPTGESPYVCLICACTLDAATPSPFNKSQEDALPQINVEECLKL